MKCNFTKVSALIMVATTGMSTMMPVATTVAWANEAVAQKGTEEETTEQHQYGEEIIDGYTPSEDGTGHYVNKHKECTVCGAEIVLEPEFHVHTEGETLIDESSRMEPTCSADGGYDLVTYCTDCGYEMSREPVVLPATGVHDWDDVYLEWPTDHSDFIESYTELNFSLHQHCMNCGKENDEIESSSVIRYTGKYTSNAYFYKNLEKQDGKLTDYWIEYTVEQSLYPCKPGILKVIIYTKDKNGENQPIGTREYDYYASLYEYKHMSDHVDGETETYIDSDGDQHLVTHCAKCGDVIKDEIIPVEKKLGQVTGLKAVSNDIHCVEITWDALEGADGYIILGITNYAYGAQIGYTTGTSFLDNYCRVSEYNYYWVVPYFKNANGKIVKGELTGYVYAIGQTYIDVNAKAVENGVELTWDSRMSATSYIIKAKKASAEKATVIATVTDTEYVDTNASADEFTFYWVFPCYTDWEGKTIVGAIDTSKYVYGKMQTRN